MAMLCFLGGTITPENEKELQQYDAPDVQIHLFDNVFSEISLGKALAVVDQLQGDSAEDMIFYTDIEGVYRYVNAFLKNVFTKALLAEKIYDCQYVVSEYENLILLERDQQWQSSNDLHAVIGKTQALKNFIAQTESSKRCGEYINEVSTRFGTIYKDLQYMPKEFKDFYWRFLEEYAEFVREEEWEFRIFALSALLSEKKETIYLEMICNEVLQAHVAL